MSAVQHQRSSAAPGAALLPVGIPVRRVQLLVVLLAIAAGSGLLLDVYGDETAFARNAHQGADLVSVLLTVPLWLALRSARRGSVRALLLLLGGLGYVTYQYAYTFAYGWNRLFPVYLTLLALSAFTLAEMLIRLDVGAVAESLDRRAPVAVVARLLLVVGPPPPPLGARRRQRAPRQGRRRPRRDLDRRPPERRLGRHRRLQRLGPCRTPATCANPLSVPARRDDHG